MRGKGGGALLCHLRFFCPPSLCQIRGAQVCHFVTRAAGPLLCLRAAVFWGGLLGVREDRPCRQECLLGRCACRIRQSSDPLCHKGCFLHIFCALASKKRALWTFGRSSFTETIFSTRLYSASCGCGLSRATERLLEDQQTQEPPCSLSPLSSDPVSTRSGPWRFQNALEATPEPPSAGPCAGGHSRATKSLYQHNYVHFGLSVRC